MEMAGRLRYRLPDVAVVINDERAGEKYLHRAPDLAVEIRSPEDSLTELLQKSGEYLANGGKLVWIIVPEEESIWAVSAGSPIRTFVKGESIDGGDVLPGFQLAVDDLFR
jgi:Uma2 family endonuclease